MVKSYTPFIQVRNVSSSDKKKVFVKGYASIKNKPDLYNYMKLPNGKTRKFRSIFTDNCIEDMKKQFMNKRIFIDIGHETATYDGILRMLKEKGAKEEEIKDAKEMLELRRLPIAKPVDLEADDTGLLLSIETNPYYAVYSDDYNKQYEATCGSLLDGYLKGFSNNFEVESVVTEKDDEGNTLDKIEKINWFGTSLTDNMALADNNFAEVSVRHIMQIRNQKGENMGKDEGKKDEGNNPPPKDEPPKPAEVKPAESEDKIEKEVQRRVAEEKEKMEVEKQKKEQIDSISEMRKELDELKQKKEPQPKGIVKETDKYGGYTGKLDNPMKDPNWVNERLKKITEQHNIHMEDVNRGISPSKAKGKFFGGWGELIALQAGMGAHMARKPTESEFDYQYRLKAAERNPRDEIVLQRLKRL